MAGCSHAGQGVVYVNQLKQSAKKQSTSIFVWRVLGVLAIQQLFVYELLCVNRVFVECFEGVQWILGHLWWVKNEHYGE